jgi:hypothetical protein
MLTIKNSQMQSIDELRENEFIEDLINDVYFDTEEAEMYSHQQLFQKLKVQAQNAKRKYGFLHDQAIAIYIATAFLFGENFDEDIPAMKSILTMDLDDNTKAEALEQLSTSIFDVLAPEEEDDEDEDDEEGEV